MHINSTFHEVVDERKTDHKRAMKLIPTNSQRQNEVNNVLVFYYIITHDRKDH